MDDFLGYCMLDLVMEVAKRRFEKGDKNRDIKISSFLMRQAIDDYNNFLNKNRRLKYIHQNEVYNEFPFEYRGVLFIVKNRFYVDNSNDPDVEEVLLDWSKENLYGEK